MNDIRLSLFKTWNVRPFGGGDKDNGRDDGYLISRICVTNLVGRKIYRGFPYPFFFYGYIYSCGVWLFR